jgi:mRNA-degrading endonuclease toxin of MazEF toxin-antitoxin module
MKRGDVIVVRFPHPSGTPGKKRPAVVVQANSSSGVIRTVIIAEITSNLTMAADPTCIFIDTTTPKGQATGLVQDSVVSCLVLVTVYVDQLDRVLGQLSSRMMNDLDNSLKAALALS